MICVNYYKITIFWLLMSIMGSKLHGVSLLKGVISIKKVLLMIIIIITIFLILSGCSLNKKPTIEHIIPEEVIEIKMTDLNKEIKVTDKDEIEFKRLCENEVVTLKEEFMFLKF